MSVYTLEKVCSRDLTLSYLALSFCREKTFSLSLDGRNKDAKHRTDSGERESEKATSSEMASRIGPPPPSPSPPTDNDTIRQYSIIGHGEFCPQFPREGDGVALHRTFAKRRDSHYHLPEQRGILNVREILARNQHTLLYSHMFDVSIPACQRTCANGTEQFGMKSSVIIRQRGKSKADVNTVPI